MKSASSRVCASGVARSQNSTVGPLAWSPDGKTLAVLTGDATHSTVWLWDVATGKNIRQAPLGVGLPGQIGYSADGPFIAVADVDQVSLVSLATGKTLRRLESR